VLVVEDEPSVREVTRRMLESGGYQVVTAANGGEALLFVENHGDEVDLLLTDVVMPSMSGSQLAVRLTGIRPDLKVIFMSGYTDDAITHQGVLDPGANFISKPVPRLALLARVREVLDTSAPIDSR